MRKRRTFTAEFKREAVRQLDLGEESPTELARRLGVPRNKLYRWQGEINQKGVEAFSRSEAADGMASENARLKQELEAAREEVDILKKAAAFFARELK